MYFSKNSSCRYFKKFHPALDKVDLISMDNNYLIIADIQGQISIIFQMHSIKSFMSPALASFWPINLRKYPNRFMGQNCSYSYSLSFLINKPI